MRIENRLGFFAKSQVISLLIIAVIALALRLHFSHFDLPVTSDALLYFNYATDMAVLGHLPSYPVPNNGWPAFLSFFFSVLHSSNFMDYMALQRLVTICLSVVTIVPIYLFSRRFFPKSYSILAASVFVFEPRVIQNSLFGISDPLYLIAVAISLVLLTSPRNKLVYTSFAIIAVASIIRSEGLFLLPAFSILFFLRYRINRQSVPRYLAVLAVFALIIIPVSLIRIESVGNDWLTTRVALGASNIADQSKEDQFGSIRYVLDGFVTLARFFGLSMIPYLAFFVPIGIFLVIKNRASFENKLLVIVPVFMLMPILYAYTIPALDSRYLLPLYPIFAIMSIYTVRLFVKRIAMRKILVVLFVLGMIFLSSVFLYYKDVDVVHEKEALELAYQVVEKTSVIYTYPNESSYLAVVGIANTQNFPTSTSNFSKIPKQLNIGQQIQTLEDTIKSGRENGLTHLVVDDAKNRKSFFNDVYYNEGKYPYLEKTFDSKDLGYDYHLKIFRINYDLFDSR